MENEKLEMKNDNRMRTYNGPSLLREYKKRRCPNGFKQKDPKSFIEWQTISDLQLSLVSFSSSFLLFIYFSRSTLYHVFKGVPSSLGKRARRNLEPRLLLSGGREQSNKNRKFFILVPVLPWEDSRSCDLRFGT